MGRTRSCRMVKVPCTPRDGWRSGSQNAPRKRCRPPKCHDRSLSADHLATPQGGWPGMSCSTLSTSPVAPRCRWWGARSPLPSGAHC
eukprot:4332829-Prymnesium_polylepis.2